jgi:hypothetical protein
MGEQASLNEKVDLFFKKSQGVSYAYPDEVGNKKIGLEPGLNARARIYPNKQLFMYEIPDIAYDTDLSSTVVNITYNSQNVGTCREHNSFYYIKKYFDLKLKHIQSQRSFWFIGTDESSSNPDSTNKLNNAIPYNYNFNKTYTPIVKINGTTVSSDSGHKQWYFDTDAGVLTFYENLTIAENDKVTITFWRYEGPLGFPNIRADAPKLIFDGGVPSTNFNENVGNVVVISGGGPG